MFRKSLVKMFEDKGLDCVFLETNMSMKKHYHMVYECIPLPKEVGDMAPVYFKVFTSIFCIRIFCYCAKDKSCLDLCIFLFISKYQILYHIKKGIVKRFLLIIYLLKDM